MKENIPIGVVLYHKNLDKYVEDVVIYSPAVPREGDLLELRDGFFVVDRVTWRVTSGGNAYPSIYVHHKNRNISM